MPKAPPKIVADRFHDLQRSTRQGLLSWQTRRRFPIHRLEALADLRRRRACWLHLELWAVRPLLGTWLEVVTSSTIEREDLNADGAARHIGMMSGICASNV
jgi:hypothetical protein